ncbi:MAG: hypothetical protein WDA16_14810, partial [Candidatus Thermoplasmatota archaeon]
STEKPLTAALQAAKAEPITELREQPAFVYPAAQARAASSEIRIGYSVPVKDFNKVKKKLGVSKPREVGEGTFTYYLNEAFD